MFLKKNILTFYILEFYSIFFDLYIADTAGQLKINNNNLSRFILSAYQLLNLKVVLFKYYCLKLTL